MNGYAELSPDEAQALMKSEHVYVIDIRDDNSFSTAHISDAVQLGQTSIGPFLETCLLYTSPSPRDRTRSRMPSSA